MNNKMFYSYIKNKWWEASNTRNIDLDKISYLEKRKRERNTNIIISKVGYHFNSFPDSKREREIWKKRGEEFIKAIIKKDDTLKLKYLTNYEKESYFESTKTFIKESRKFDRDLSISNIGQAMRNVWIVNILQSILGKTIGINKGVFGYSMLYPYTDNYLDNTDIKKEDKKDFNNRFTKRLLGEFIKAKNDNEKKIYRLVEYIEETFNREEYKEVYESLLEIHKGQILSLTQQDKVSIPYDKDILEISLEKGAASVLVDGYVIDGYLEDEDIKLCLWYGFILQLADDLQDVKEDIKNNHMTIMSQLAGKYHLDTMANKLINFTNDFVEELKPKGDNGENIKLLIKNDCIMLILFSIVASREYFSKDYVKNIEEYLPFTINYIEELRCSLKEKIINDKSEKELTDILDEAVSD